MTTRSPGPRVGRRTFSTYVRKLSPLIGTWMSHDASIRLGPKAAREAGGKSPSAWRPFRQRSHVCPGPSLDDEGRPFSCDAI